MNVRKGLIKRVVVKFSQSNTVRSNIPISLQSTVNSPQLNGIIDLLFPIYHCFINLMLHSAIILHRKQLPMSESKTLQAIAATEVPPRTKPSNYPEPFLSRMAGREKRPLGDYFGLENFGVNLTTLEPGGETSLMHSHSKQEEMIYIVQGNATLVTESGETTLTPGMCAGFRVGGEGSYPRDDLRATMGEDGMWRFVPRTERRTSTFGPRLRALI